MTTFPPWRQSLRDSRLMIVLDLSRVAVVFAGVHFTGHHPGMH